MEGRFLQILSFLLPVLFLSFYQCKAHGCRLAGESLFGDVPGWPRLPQAKHHAAPRLGQDGQEQGQALGREANSGPSMTQGQN